MLVYLPSLLSLPLSLSLSLHSSVSPLPSSSGSDHVVFLTEHNDIYTFGCAEQGQLGRVPECFSSRGGRKGVSLILNPDVVRCRVKEGAGKPKFFDIFSGPYHTFAVTQDGAVYAWGLNNYGQLCTGDSKTRYQPERLGSKWLDRQEVGGAKDFAMASGQHHTVVCCNGSVFVCGRKEYGRLGLGQESEEPSKPTQIDSLKGINVKNIGVGGACSFAVTETGELFSWGMGTNLQLGMSDEEDVWSPAKVTGKKIENMRVVAVSSGGQHTALLVSASET